MSVEPFSLIGSKVLDEMCACAATTPFGNFVEVGVYQGGSAWRLYHIAKQQQRKLYLYDTFEGIPHSNPGVGDSHKVGDFNDTSVEQVKLIMPEAIVVKGVFPQSAVPMGAVSFVHLDVDQYQSYKEAIAFFRPLMLTGGMMWFDDDGLVGAKRAMDEEFGEKLRLAGCGKYFTIF